MDVQDQVRAERLALLEVLQRLTPEQWDTPTLCEGWRVRHVVGHLISGTQSTMGGLVGGMIRSGFNLNTFLRDDGLRKGAGPIEDLLGAFETAVEATRRPPGTKPIDVLTDVTVHGQDIRRPLGIQRQIPAERLGAVLDTLSTVGFPLGVKKRIAGLRLVATDVGWAHGAGPEVRGTGEALMMVMGGRRAALGELEGEGAEVIASRR